MILPKKLWFSKCFFKVKITRHPLFLKKSKCPVFQTHINLAQIILLCCPIWVSSPYKHCLISLQTVVLSPGVIVKLLPFASPILLYVFCVFISFFSSFIYFVLWSLSFINSFVKNKQLDAKYIKSECFHFSMFLCLHFFLWFYVFCVECLSFMKQFAKTDQIPKWTLCFTSRLHRLGCCCNSLCFTLKNLFSHSVPSFAI